MEQRTIKFRAWDMHKKEMWNSNNIVVGNGVYLYGTHNLVTNVFSYQEVGFIPMQFTGLLDKNGKEIYEGDIVRNNEGPNIYTFPVVFKNGIFGDEVNDSQIDSLYELKIEHLEIIGNIYENPLSSESNEPK